MSHIVEIKTQVKDAAAIRAGCNRLRLPTPIEGTHRLFGGEVIGLGVQLPDWKYVVVCDLPSGELKYDNYNGRWGEQKHLDRFLQIYAVEKSTHSQCTSCYDSCRLVTRGNSLQFRLAF